MDEIDEFSDEIVASDGLPARSAGLWAKKKLELLKEYIHRFTVGMKPTDKKKYNWKGLVYIDLFAGPGKCIIRETQEEINGSPLIARTAPWPFTEMYFVERDQKNAEALKKRLGADSRCIVLNEDCNDAVRKITANAKSGYLYLAFIDPTGLNIRFDTVELLSISLKKCDILMNWYMSSIKRNIPQWIRTKNFTIPNAFFGTEDWLKYCDEANMKITTDKLRDLYQKRLQKIGYDYQANPEVVKNSKGAEMYWLWFASKEELGLKFWKSSKKTTDIQGELF